jgi:transcriptional regulator with XRE-family HTH domain
MGTVVTDMRHESHINLDAAKLLAEMNRRGLSAAQLAKVAGVSPTTISGIVAHGRPVTVRTARRIAAALVSTPIIDGLENLLVA